MVMEKRKKQYPLNAKNMFGLSTMRWMVIAGSSLMTAAFMIYLTDYSGVANAAVVATVLLTFGRVFDAANDPLQGWIMDRSPVTKIGRFKPFMLGGILVSALAVLMLFNMPRNTPEWYKIGFLFLGYILYETGISFQPDYALKATMTDNPQIREKLLVTPRIIEQFVAVPFSFFITIALIFGESFGNNHKGFSVATLLLILPIAAIAFIGVTCIKEGPYIQQTDNKVGMRDILAMFKSNRPLWISQLSGIIGGCVFTFVTAAVSYYIKWAYGPENFGTYSAVFGAMILLGIVTGTLLAPRMLRNTPPRNGVIICSLAQVAPLAVIYILNFIITIPPVVFFAMIFGMMVFSGMGYIPGSMVNMECMDYNLWKLGQGMEGMVQSISSFVSKAQVALAGLATGAVLVVIKYDAAFYESEDFAASGSMIPEGLLDGLALVFCLIPVVLGIVAALIMKAYPLRQDERDCMYNELEARRKAGEIR